MFEKYLLEGIAFDPNVQRTVAAAGYYRDTENLDEYKTKSPFLAALNNEVGEGTPSFEKHKKRI